MSLLVTTAIEQTWGDDEQVVFLGEWCRLYDRKVAWANRQHRVVPHHWYDRDKLKKDHDYLKLLHDSLLNELTTALNKYHGIQRPLRYWQILLDPWLLTYVAVVFDRWECLRSAFEENERLDTISLTPALGTTPPAGYDEFNAQVLGDDWNYQLFLQIIQETYADRCAIRPQPRLSDSSVSRGRLLHPGVSLRVKRSRIVRFLDAIAGLWPARDRVVFFKSYFSPAALVRLNVSLGQVPRLYLREFEAGHNAVESRRANAMFREPGAISLDGAPRNAFEHLLRRRLVQDMPFSYIEWFVSLKRRADAIRMRPAVILTANAHWGNELFKLWSAEQVSKGARLIAMEHGGSIPPRFDTMFFEEDISDFKTTWAHPYHPKHVRLPPSKVVARARRFARSSRRWCLAIGYESWRYGQRATAYPVSAQTLVSSDMVCDLYGLLHPEIRAAFLVKPFGDQGWNTRKRFGDKLGSEKVSKEPSYYRLLRQARLVLCTYPNTTFSEAIVSGVPTILMYPRNLFETVTEFDDLLQALMAAKVVFHDARSAAEHVNSVWNDTDGWWALQETRAVRAKFHRLALSVDGDWFRPWKSFLDRFLV